MVNRSESSANILLNQNSVIEEIDEDHFYKCRDVRFQNLKRGEFIFKNGFKFGYLKDGANEGPVMITLHDIGQDPTIAFGKYFMNPIIEPILAEFCIYHLELPGQMTPDDILYTYPTFDQLAEGINDFVKSLDKSYVVGFGIGAGANVLIRSSLKNSKIFGGLIFINGYANSMGWMEYFNQKFQLYNTTDEGINSYTVDHLTNHFFSDDLEEDINYLAYQQYLSTIQNPHNLKLLLESFASRTPIHLTRPTIHHGSQLKGAEHNSTIPCDTLLIVSGQLSQYQDCIELNSLLDTAMVEIVEFHNGHGMILDQYPDKITYAIFLFLQGMGYLRGVQKPV